MRRHRAAVVLVVIALAAAGAGCASGEGGGPVADGTASTTAPAFAVTTLAPDDAAVAVADVVTAEGVPDEPGCAVGVARGGTPIFRGGYGVADLATGQPIGPETTFDIASVSKQFTAAAVVLLADRGELDLEDPVGTYVPELPPAAGAVTLEQLLHHTGGLPEYTELLGEEYDDTDVTTTAQALDAVAGAGGPAFTPGSEFEYSNTGYFLLALVVARVSGESFGAFVDRELFEPLGMEASVVRDDADLDVPDGAEGYLVTGDGGFEPDTTNWEQVGDGAVWTSVDDLLRWAANLTTFAVGGAALRAGMLTPGPVPDDEEGLGYGGGLTLGDGIIEHSGAWAGFLSELVVVPATDTAVVVLCNRDDAYPYDLAVEVLDVLDAGP